LWKAPRRARKTSSGTVCHAGSSRALGRPDAADPLDGWEFLLLTEIGAAERGQARDYAVEALRRARAIGTALGAFWAMQHLAAAAVFGSSASDHRSELRRAAGILGFVDAATARRGMPRYATEQHEYDAVLSVLRKALGEDEVERLMVAGKAWSEKPALAEALAT